MKTQSGVLALAFAATANTQAHVNMLESHAEPVVCRTYVTTVLLPCTCLSVQTLSSSPIPALSSCSSNSSGSNDFSGAEFTTSIHQSLSSPVISMLPSSSPDNSTSFETSKPNLSSFNFSTSITVSTPAISSIRKSASSIVPATLTTSEHVPYTSPVASASSDTSSVRSPTSIFSTGTSHTAVVSSNSLTTSEQGSPTALHSSVSFAVDTSTTLPAETPTTVSSSSTLSASPTAPVGTVTGFYCGCEWLINDEDLYCVNKSSGSFELLYQDLAAGDGARFNALAFHPQSTTLYAIVEDPNFENPQIAQIDGTGKYTILGGFDYAAKVGEIDDKISFWVMDNTTWSQIDIDIYHYGTTFATTLATGTIPNEFSYYVYDWAFIPGAGDYLWSVGTSKSDGTAALVRFSRSSHHWDIVKDFGQVAGVDEFGPAWGYLGGKLWTAEVKTGNIYEIQVPDGTPELISVSKVLTPAFSNDVLQTISHPAGYYEARQLDPRLATEELRKMAHALLGNKQVSHTGIRITWITWITS